MTLREWHHWIEEALSSSGVENASQEAKWLLAAALNKDPSYSLLYPSYCPDSQEEETIRTWTSRRLKGEPLSRIKGAREFWSLLFHLNSHTLDPRPDSEILVEATLKWMGQEKDKPWRILDLGTGSGCLLISLLHECPQATGLGVDRSEEALQMARFNASLHNVHGRASFQRGNWTESLKGPFDIIISNPPYIRDQEEDSLPKAVRDFDPPLALFGGEDGLEAYRALSLCTQHLLSPGDLLVLEIGCNQAAVVEDLFQKQGFQKLFLRQDLAGHDRVLGFSA